MKETGETAAVQAADTQRAGWADIGRQTESGRCRQ